MSKIKEIYVEVGFTKSLPNYQNIKFTAGATVLVGEQEDVNKVYKETWDKMGEEIEGQIKLFEGEKKSGVKKGL